MPARRNLQFRKADGTLCGEAPDRSERHAHGLRDFCASYHQRVTGFVSVKEQRVAAWDRVSPRTGRLEEAQLDVATRDAVTGQTVFLDTSVTCAHSGTAPRQQARSNKDGLAATNAEDAKRARYPPEGGQLIPVIFETGGRPGDATMACVRSWGHDMAPAERTEVIRYGWQQLSTRLHLGNAETILAAIGH